MSTLCTARSVTRAALLAAVFVTALAAAPALASAGGASHSATAAPAVPALPAGLFARSAVTQVKLIANDGATSDTFGRSVAISGDTAVVGVPDDRVGSNNEQGSVYVFVRSGAGWIQQQRLTAADGSGGDRLGHKVAIWGDTIVAGALADDNGAVFDQGSAYVFVRSGAGWTQQQRLTAADGASGDGFGSSVAVSGDTIVAGAAYDDVGSDSNQGSAYVFVRGDAGWTQYHLTAADGTVGDSFGCSVAISGDTAVVGAHGDDIGTNENQGSAYVFVRSGPRWPLDKKLTAGREGAEGNAFGNSVAVSGGTAVVGAPYVGNNRGRAYVFARDAEAGWIRQARLAASDAADYDDFGYAVAISGGTAVVGAYQNTIGSTSTRGSAYVYTRSGSAWTQRLRLLARDGRAYDSLGVSVGLSGGNAVAGAYLCDIGANKDQGAAYVWTGLISPSIRALSPTSGKTGATVTITGKGFGARRGTSKVVFGNTAATRYVDWSASKIKVKVPRVTMGKKTVKVQTSMGPSNVKYFWRR